MVADAGPLIGLARADGLYLVRSVFDEVLLPPAVSAECCRDISRPGAEAIRAAVASGELRVEVAAKEADVVWPPGLGSGERKAIELALDQEAGVLMDDLLGRRMAKHLALPVLGTGGLLLLAKARGAIERIGPWLVALRQHGYFMSRALVQELLRRADES